MLTKKLATAAPIIVCHIQVPYPFAGHIEALKEGRARVIFLNLVGRPSGRARDGPFPTFLCRTWIKQVRCTLTAAM